ncbi:MAG TPA: hypothetical protein VF092_00395 [Longimicrobium sp.]
MRTFVRYDAQGNIVATAQVAELPRGREHPWVDLKTGEQALEVTLPPDAGFNDLRQIHRGKVDVKTKQVVPLDKAGKGKAEKTRKARAKAKPKTTPRPRVPPIRPPSGFPAEPGPGGATGATGTTGTVTPGGTPKVMPGTIASRPRKPAVGETPPTIPENPSA